MVNGPRPGAQDSPAAAHGKDTRTGNGRSAPDSDGPTGAAWPVTTWQGWQHFATTPPPQPPAPGEPERSTEERLAYHFAFVTVRTPAIDTLTTNARTLMILGQHQQTTARPSLIVTGPAAAGKTTALLHTGRTCHLAHNRQHPPSDHSTQAPVPVAYVLVPPAASAKALATEFARYLGIPVTGRMTRRRSPTPSATPTTTPVCAWSSSTRSTASPPHHHRRGNRRPAERPHRTHPRDLRVRGRRRHPHRPVLRGTRSTTRRAGIPGGMRSIPRPPRETRTVPRTHHRRGSSTRSAGPPNRHTPPPRRLPPQAHRRPHRVPHQTHPPSSHHRHQRRHRTHHQASLDAIRLDTSQKPTTAHPNRPPHPTGKPPPRPDDLRQTAATRQTRTSPLESRPTQGHRKISTKRESPTPAGPSPTTPRSHSLNQTRYPAQNHACPSNTPPPNDSDLRDRPARLDHDAYSTLTKLRRVCLLLGPLEPHLPLYSRTPRYEGRNRGYPSKGPPTFPPRARNSTMTRRLKSSTMLLGSRCGGLS